jgi:F0F1-type ATP synthase assembly protein I
MTETLASVAVLAQESSSSNAGIFIASSLVGILIGGGIGYLIGNSKGRPGLGVILGALLGCIGWIIVAIIPRKNPQL